MGEKSRPYRRLVFVSDTESYSARSTVLQHRAQEVFAEAMAAAGRAAGMDRDAWQRQPTGDGELAVLPADVDEPALLGAFPAALDTLLRRHNANLLTEARIRVRIAVHEGLIFTDSRNGFAGDAVNTAARLVDAPLLKTAFGEFAYANVAVIVSDRIYRDVVAGGYDGIRPERFRRIPVELPDKRFAEHGWIHVVGEDVTATGPAAAPGRSAPPVPPPSGGGTSAGNIQNTDGQVAVGQGATALGSTPRRYGS